MTEERALREEIVRVCKEMLASGLTRGTSGNVSARFARGMLITPSAVPYAELEPDMLLHVELSGSHITPDGYLENAGRYAEPERPVTGSGALKRTTEWRMHAAILLARPEIGAVLHAHPPFGTALACLRRSIPSFHYMVAIAGGHDIRCADYATFGTPELAAHALSALTDRTACILANHGTVALGSSPTSALALAIEVEALAEQYCHALAAGEPVLLSGEEMQRVRIAFREYRGTDS